MDFIVAGIYAIKAVSFVDFYAGGAKHLDWDAS